MQYDRNKLFLREISIFTDLDMFEGIPFKILQQLGIYNKIL